MPSHPTVAFALDVADKLLKLAAVILGGIWTWWNYRKSRTYAQKLELELTGALFAKGNLYIDVLGTLKNVGAAKHIVETDNTFCTLFVIRADLSEVPLRIFPIFTHKRELEPGESVNDALFSRIEPPWTDILWIKIHLRVVSGEVEWNTVSILRVESSNALGPLKETA